MKIIKIGQLRGPTKGQAKHVISALLNVYNHIEVITSKEYDGEAALAQYKKDFENAIIDLIAISMHIAGDGNVSLNCFASHMSHSWLLAVAGKADKSLELFCEKDVKLEDAAGALKENLKSLKDGKDNILFLERDAKRNDESAEIAAGDSSGKPSGKLTKAWAWIPKDVKAFSLSSLALSLSKFCPRASGVQKITQALRYMDYISYACMAVSSAALLIRGGSALKKNLLGKWEGKSNNEYEMNHFFVQ